MKKFKNTSEIEPYDGIIGQQRAEKAMQFGLKMNNPAYNIYVSGNCGSGRITYTIKAIESQQIDESKIKDWCYVYNFKEGKPNYGMFITYTNKDTNQYFKEDNYILENVLYVYKS